ncbi:ExbD/TolR family protein [Marinobacter caseinilyticus]|uniref:ExbD/TolR family protein n=1 Tax=Marinobacter caseinilyticus TaxID=2692195 RepID=UPI00140D656D|nr:biopolymer transporter ExbD [Marinobacter caseinilyticus]
MQLVDPRPARPLPIRITPLIDVVFILLVFFMLTTRLLPTNYLALDNRTEAGTPSAGKPVPDLLLRQTGKLHWRDRDWTLLTLVPALAGQGIDRINLTTAAQAPLSDFTLTLSVLSDAGIEAHWQRTPANSGTH